MGPSLLGCGGMSIVDPKIRLFPSWLACQILCGQSGIFFLFQFPFVFPFLAMCGRETGFGSTENAGPENYGPLKFRRGENIGHEI